MEVLPEVVPLPDVDPVPDVEPPPHGAFVQTIMSAFAGMACDAITTSEIAATSANDMASPSDLAIMLSAHTGCR